jgi:hypothetical protein
MTRNVLQARVAPKEYNQSLNILMIGMVGFGVVYVVYYRPYVVSI